MTDISLLLAFVAGVLGFASPCIVPLIPGYLSFVSGLSLAEMDLPARRARLGQVLAATALFVLGFSVIFTALGASASALGSFVVDNRVALGRVGGIVVVLLGLSVLGVIRVPGLFRERRLQVARRPGGLLGAVPVGMAFGFAWTPCVGPVLAAILTLAATAQGAAGGALLLFAYSLGLGLPFLVAAVLVTTAVDALGWLRRHGRVVEVFSGGFLVMMGAAMIFDLVFRLNAWMLRVVPFRPAL
ncbi:MAG: cytochrome c biogenesis protein CcdA [Armatimonadota bacterium]|nr:cytochrome c biogenesis protein CcdA [Armatimonadota bacterium]MDR7451876.1 cytochrome c biogenesis protein CcdA [Armatimonadota bacterium]MDR7467601.1 cytochrome c biogenesis protein CcdA [Armatimonadota bacterium]MDR7494438.1 cytochrome c biogenesis protein CcdA [Armatimonadota bacterium]MDR7500418.1 cytochrome c biogenesis protein CcdA [Armatimonadota bacterium]